MYVFVCVCSCACALVFVCVCACVRVCVCACVRVRLLIHSTRARSAPGSAQKETRSNETCVLVALTRFSPDHPPKSAHPLLTLALGLVSAPAARREAASSRRPLQPEAARAREGHFRSEPEVGSVHLAEQRDLGLRAAQR